MKEDAFLEAILPFLEIAIASSRSRDVILTHLLHHAAIQYKQDDFAYDKQHVVVLRV